MSDEKILNVYKQVDDAEIDNWILGDAKPAAQPVAPTAPEPVAAQSGGGFFNPVAGFVKRAATATSERFFGGIAQVGEAVSGKKSQTLSGLVTGESQEFKDTPIQLGDRTVTIPASVMRAIHGATGALGMILPIRKTKPAPREK